LSSQSQFGGLVPEFNLHCIYGYKCLGWSRRGCSNWLRRWSFFT